MTKKIKNLFTKLFVFFLNALGISTFVSCDGIINNIGGIAVMYGMPVNCYEVTGKITGDANEDGETEGIPAIKISVKEIYEDNSEQVLSETSTDENGNYDLYWEQYNRDFNFIITVEDVDGKENGSFETEIVPKDYSEKYNELSESTGNSCVNIAETMDLELKNKDE